MLLLTRRMSSAWAAALMESPIERPPPPRCSSCRSESMTTRNKVGDRTDPWRMPLLILNGPYTLYVLEPALYQSPAFLIYTTLVEVSQKGVMHDGVKGLF